MNKVICHMTSVHTSRDVRIFYKQCTSLAAAGHSVYLVAPGESRNENNVNIIGIGEMPKSRLKRIFSFTRKVFKVALSLDCDIYHLHDPELIPYGLKLLKKGKRVIFDSHEDVFSYIEDKRWIPVLFRGLVSTFSENYFRKVLPLFSSLIAVTPHLYDQLFQINNKSYMITNYPILENENVNNCKDDLRDHTSFDLIYAGGVVPKWSHAEIIESIQDIEGVNYCVYGNARREYINSLNQLDKSNRFKYLGVAPFHEISYRMSEASVGMAVLKYENNTGWKRGTLGNTKLFEYFSACLPVICTDFDLWEEIILKYNCGVCVSPTNVDEITNAVIFLLENRDLAQQMGLNGRRAVEQEYNWKSQEKILFELYDNLIEK